MLQVSSHTMAAGFSIQELAGHLAYPLQFRAKEVLDLIDICRARGHLGKL